jgi:proline racemase
MVHELRLEHDAFRTEVVCEPRGYDALVGALLCQPHDSKADFGVIYFNNAGYLGMCGHATIGLLETLQYMGQIGPGEYRIETPVGTVRGVIGVDRKITVYNVRSYRYKAAVKLDVPGFGCVEGDVAYGGNWFFVVPCKDRLLHLDNVQDLVAWTSAIRKALNAAGITGVNGAEIDHIEVSGPPSRGDAHARNFVLCPGLQYDRSPCGSGTCAKMACLAADGKLNPGDVWRQEGILGTVFEGSYEPRRDGILPQITGRAFVTGGGTLLFDDEDSMSPALRIHLR